MSLAKLKTTDVAVLDKNAILISEDRSRVASVTLHDRVNREVHVLIVAGAGDELAAVDRVFGYEYLIHGPWRLEKDE